MAGAIYAPGGSHGPTENFVTPWPWNMSLLSLRNKGKQMTPSDRKEEKHPES